MQESRDKDARQMVPGSGYKAAFPAKNNQTGINGTDGMTMTAVISVVYKCLAITAGSMAWCEVVYTTFLSFNTMIWGD